MSYFPDHFSDRAQAYARSRPTYPRELLDYLIDISRNAGRVWEPGCGSGQLSLLLAEAVSDVYATDASPTQIAHATAARGVHYHCALAESSALATVSMDLVVVAQAAHWFQLPRFYEEARRVAKPRSPLVLLSYGNTHVNAEVDAVVLSFHEYLLNGYWPAERIHVDAGYKTLDFPFDDIPAPEIVMQSNWDLAAFLNYIETWSGVRALINAGGMSTLEQFHHDVEQAWGNAATRRAVRWPLAIRAAIL